jgi:hypothetical protein
MYFETSVYFSKFYSRYLKYVAVAMATDSGDPGFKCRAGERVCSLPCFSQALQENPVQLSTNHSFIWGYVVWATDIVVK